MHYRSRKTEKLLFSRLILLGTSQAVEFLSSNFAAGTMTLSSAWNSPQVTPKWPSSCTGSEGRSHCVMPLHLLQPLNMKMIQKKVVFEYELKVPLPNPKIVECFFKHHWSAVIFAEHSVQSTVYKIVLNSTQCQYFFFYISVSITTKINISDNTNKQTTL